MRTGLRSLAPLALMAAIFALSAQSSTGAGLPEVVRIAGHFGQYLLLTTLWAWALVPSLGRRALVAAIAISALYAISDEYHQSFVDGRDAGPFDVMVDWTGVAAAGLLWRRRGVSL